MKWFLYIAVAFLIFFFGCEHYLVFPVIANCKAALRTMSEGMPIAESYAQIVSIVITIIGAGFALYQWRKSRMVSRTLFLDDLVTSMKADDMLSTFYRYIGDHAPERFYKHIFTFAPDSEEKVDQLLSHFNKICFMRGCGAISQREYQLFAYQIHRVLRDRSACEYLFDLAFRSKTVRYGSYPFVDLVKEGLYINCSPVYAKISRRLKILSFAFRTNQVARILRL